MVDAQIINAETLTKALPEIGERFSLSLLAVHEYDMMIRFLSQNTLREKSEIAGTIFRQVLIIFPKSKYYWKKSYCKLCRG